MITTLVLLLSALGQTSAGVPQSPPDRIDDRPIIEAVLADSVLGANTDGGRFDLFETTHLAAMTYVQPPFDRFRSITANRL